MSNESLTDKITSIILALDHSSPSGDQNWSEEGEVKLSVVRAALGGLEVTREDIRATGLMRVIPAPDTEPVKADTAAPLTLEAAKAAMNAAEIAVDKERARLIAAERNVIKTRARLADTIKAWLAEWPPITFDTAHRDHIKRLQEHKAAGMVSRAESTAGTSPLDRFAAATAAHGTRQGGDAFRRGASVRRSLPSQR